MTAARRAWAGPAGVTALEAASLVVGFLTQLLLMRSLGPAAYGQCVLAVAVGVGVCTLADFGFNYAGTRQAVLWADEPLRRQRLFWAVQAVKAAVGSAALLLLALLPGTAAMLPAAALAVLGALLFPTWYLMARRRLVPTAAALLAGRVAMLLAIAAAVRGPGDAVLASALNSSAALVALAVAARDPELRALRPCRPRAPELVQAWTLGLSTLWVNAVPALGAALVQALIGQLGSHATLGQYAAADKVRAGIQGLFTALGQALFPGSVRAEVGGRRGQRLAPALLLLAALAALPLVLAPGAIVAVVAGPGYEAAADALRVMSLAVLSSTAVTAFGLLDLVSRGQDAAFARAIAAGLTAQVAALLLLVPALGASGAAWALFIADAAALALITNTLRRR
ncbi:hypothetical protein CLD22_16105 [Rubrivivax gelatinosus]|nr:hypothetical protein [Rubrivivax gelatinosus]